MNLDSEFSHNLFHVGIVFIIMFGILLIIDIFDSAHTMRITFIIGLFIGWICCVIPLFNKLPEPKDISSRDALR